MTTETNQKTKAVAITTGATAVTLSPAALAMLLPDPYSQYLLYACAVITGLCYAATFIPMPQDQTGKLSKLYKVINFLAGNAGRATNATVAIAGAVKSRSDVSAKK